MEMTVPPDDCATHQSCPLKRTAGLTRIETDISDLLDLSADTARIRQRALHRQRPLQLFRLTGKERIESRAKERERGRETAEVGRFRGLVEGEGARHGR
jgi:hypothetical protein